MLTLGYAIVCLPRLSSIHCSPFTFFAAGPGVHPTLFAPKYENTPESGNRSIGPGGMAGAESGQKLNKSFMTPIPPKSLLFLMQTGWPIDLIFPLTVEAVNGLRSRVSAGANERGGDPGFYRVIALLRKIQKSGAVGMRIKKENDQKESTVMFFYRENVTPEVKADIEELGVLLGLRQGEKEVAVSYGLFPASGREISMLTRSMLQIMVEMAAQIDVPDQHVVDGRTVPSLPKTDSPEDRIGHLIDIKSGTDKPDNAYTAINYQNHWFWIDDRDFKSKRSFAFLMILFSMTESGTLPWLPSSPRKICRSCASVNPGPILPQPGFRISEPVSRKTSR